MILLSFHILKKINKNTPVTCLNAKTYKEFHISGKENDFTANHKGSKTERCYGENEILIKTNTTHIINNLVDLYHIP